MQSKLIDVVNRYSSLSNIKVQATTADHNVQNEDGQFSKMKTADRQCSVILSLALIIKLLFIVHRSNEDV